MNLSGPKNKLVVGVVKKKDETEPGNFLVDWKGVRAVRSFPAALLRKFLAADLSDEEWDSEDSEGDSEDSDDDAPQQELPQHSSGRARKKRKAANGPQASQKQKGEPKWAKENP